MASVEALSPSASAVSRLKAFSSIPKGHTISQVRREPFVSRIVIRLLSTG
jgi:hypothetical protein